MKKLLLVAGLLVFVAICSIAGTYTHGLVQHLLFIVPAITVLRVACGKDEIKKTGKAQINQTNSFAVPTQPELEFEAKTVVNA